MRAAPSYLRAIPKDFSAAPKSLRVTLRYLRVAASYLGVTLKDFGAAPKYLRDTLKYFKGGPEDSPEGVMSLGAARRTFPEATFSSEAISGFEEVSS